MIDLHCHSYFSDGELSPSALLKKALDAHVKLLALTDHDTIEGLQELHAAAKGCDIAVIDGIELSVRWKKYDIHVLGLNINAAHPSLLDVICEQNKRRISRAQQIGDRLSIDGIDKDIAEELQNRARNALLSKVLTGEEKLGAVEPAQDLLELEGMTRHLAYILASHGIVTREDLAEKSVDEFITARLAILKFYLTDRKNFIFSFYNQAILG